MSNTRKPVAQDLPEMVLDALQDFEACVRDQEYARVRYAIASDMDNWTEADELRSAEEAREQAYTTLCECLHTAIYGDGSEGR